MCNFHVFCPSFIFFFSLLELKKKFWCKYTNLGKKLIYGGSFWIVNMNKYVILFFIHFSFFFWIRDRDGNFHQTIVLTIDGKFFISANLKKIITNLFTRLKNRFSNVHFTINWEPHEVTSSSAFQLISPENNAFSLC